jgi:hypothetical protein
MGCRDCNVSLPQGGAVKTPHFKDLKKVASKDNTKLKSLSHRKYFVPKEWG